MTDLPRCKLCQCEPFVGQSGFALHPVGNASCPQWGVKMTTAEWTALMGAGGEPVVITLGKGDKLVADIFAHDSDGIVHKAGVGIFDPSPGTVYGVGVKDTRIDGLSITSDRKPLVLIWSDKHESLQVIVDELQESVAHLAGPPPAQPARFQQIGFTRQDHIGKPSSTIVSDTKYRAASDAGAYVPVFVGEAQAPAVDGADRLRAELDAITEYNHRQFLLLENARLYAARHRKEPWGQELLRILQVGGINGSPLRGEG